MLWIMSGWRGWTIRPAIILFLMIASLVGAVWLAPPLDYLPTGNQNLVFGGMSLPGGYSQNQMTSIAERLEAQIQPYQDAAGRPERLAQLSPIQRSPFGGGPPPPPFEPTVRDGRVYARGASDDKGQVLCFIEALRAYLATGQKLPCPVTLLIEGEEECGSVTLPVVLDKHKDLLQADLCVVSDTSMWEGKHGQTPSITYALRGLVYFDLKLHGPSRDLHSGVYGGTLASPATVLARVLGKLFDDDNRIAIPGFYDDVAPPEDEERALWEQLGFDEQAFLDGVGAEPFGEAGFSTLARRWARPSCDINGLYGGYGGAGAKTVIASFAGAKVSFRIPANMDPRKVAKQFTDWIHAHDVAGCRWELTSHGEAWPVATPLDSPYVAAARRAIEAAAGRPAALIREGATIPIVADFQKTLGLDTLLIGFGLEGDNIHSPDEHFGLDRFHLGCRTNARLLSQIARVNS